MYDDSGREDADPRDGDVPQHALGVAEAHDDPVGPGRRNGDVPQQVPRFAQAHEDRVEPDPRNGEFTSFYKLYAPRLARYLQSNIRGAGVSEADAHDILQQTWFKFDKALKNPRIQIECPRAYIFGILVKCIKKRVKQLARSPGQLGDDALIPDDKNLPPDEAAAEREDRDRRRAELLQWLERLLSALDELGLVLANRPRLNDDLSTAAQYGQSPDPPRRGKPTPAEKAHRVLNGLPDTIKFLTKFFRELLSLM